METNLREVLINDELSLSETDIDDIVALLCKRCRVPTKIRIRSILTYHPSAIPTFGILSRVYKDKNGWQYCAGQSYPDEIRTVRNIIKDLK